MNENILILLLLFHFNCMIDCTQRTCALAGEKKLFIEAWRTHSTVREIQYRSSTQGKEEDIQ